MRIEAPSISELNGQIKYTAAVTHRSGQKASLWFCVDAQFREMVSKRADAALLSLLIPAMDDGEDIEILGTVTDEFVHRVESEYQTILCSVMPSLSRVSIHAPDKRPADPPAEGVATGFSGGIDSFTVLADHYLSSDLPESLRLTHLLYNDVGAHGAPLSAVFRKKSEGARRIAVSLGLPLIVVQSNMDEFYPSHLFFQQTHTPRNAAVPLFLQAGIGRFLYASAVPFNIAHARETDMSGAADTISLPVLSTTALELRSSGSQYSRVAKTLRVATVPQSYSTLDVCASPNGDPNCSVCWKCMRTELTLEIAGVLDRYAHVFDITKYTRAKPRYLPGILMSNDPLLREVVEFAREQKYHFSTTSYALAPIATVANRAKQKAKPYVRRWRRAANR